MAEPIANIVEYTVSEISAALKRTIEDAYGYVRVRGEISGYKGPHSSGHAYFSLKDDRARIEAVVWRMTLAKLRFKPEEGMEVIATGRITTYPGKSSYQIVIDALEPAGIGALMVQLEERKRRLATEGLFAEARKKPLPYLPRTIGVITSPTGAVIRDILHRLSDRFPVNVLLWPVRVQGETCPAEVIAAIRGFNALPPDGTLPRPDVLIVARGGGSLEDLWGFNDEGMVRAAAASAIPLISAVGHETDWTLIDLAADRRAPTPTGAAEMAVPVRTELLAALDSIRRRLIGAIGRLIETRRRELRHAMRGLPTAENVLAIPRRSLDEAAARLGRSLVANVLAHRAMLARTAGRLSVRELHRIVERQGERLSALAARSTRAVAIVFERRHKRIEALDQLLRSLSYTSVLARGFAVVRDADDVPIASAAGISSGDTLNIELRDGQVRVLATSSPAKRRARKTDGGAQGDLF